MKALSLDTAQLKVIIRPLLSIDSLCRIGAAIRVNLCCLDQLVSVKSITDMLVGGGTSTLRLL